MHIITIGTILEGYYMLGTVIGFAGGTLLGVIVMSLFYVSDDR